METLKEYLVFDKDNVNDYNLFVHETEDRTTYLLKTSNNSDWSEGHKNKEVVSMVDDGDLEYVIRVGGKKVDKITASDLDALRIVLNFAWQENDNKYKLIENNDANFIKV